MRCFIAIDLDKNLKDKVYDLQKRFNSFQNITFVNKNILHFTVVFFGEINEKQIEVLIDSISKIKMKPFNITLRGVDSFKRGSNEGVIYIKMSSGVEEFNELHLKIKQSIKNISIEDEQKPHLTMIRVRNNKEIFNVLKDYFDYEVGSFYVKEFVLKRSKLTDKGPIYEDIATFNLEG